MNIEGRYRLVAVAVMVAALAAMSYLLIRSPSVPASVGKEVSAASLRGGNSNSGNRLSPPAQQVAATKAGTDENIDEYICFIKKELCLDDPLAAATESEARWLLQFGYPSHRRLEQLEGMAISELEALSENGDLTARVVLGKKRIEIKEYTQGRNEIFSALLNGNTYAAIEYARSNRPDVSGSSLSEARAFYRVAYLLGDRKAVRESYMAQQKYGGANELEMALSDERAMELYRNILKYRGENHIPLRVWPRP